MAGRSLLDHSHARSDPRRSWKVVHPPPETLPTGPCGRRSEVENVGVIDVLRRRQPAERGVSSHETCVDVMNVLPPALFGAPLVGRGGGGRW